MCENAGAFGLADDEGRVYLIDNHIALVSDCVRFVRKALNGDGVILQEVEARGKERVRITELAKELGMLPKYGTLHDEGRAFHPYVNLFLSVYRSHKIFDLLSHGGSMGRESSESQFDGFIDFVNMLRTVAKKHGVKKRASDWESKIKKNKKKTESFERELFERHSKMLVIRLDLHLRKDRVKGGEEVAQIVEGNERRWESACRAYEESPLFGSGENISNIKNEINSSGGIGIPKADGILSGDGCDVPNQAGPLRLKVGFEEIADHRRRLFQNFKGKPSLFRHLVGYVWRIEATPVAGYHIHLILFFNGHKVQKDAFLAREIGDYWVSDITKGAGYYRNINADWKGTEKTYGIGMVEAADLRKRYNLVNHVMAYLCKKDQAVLKLPYIGCNTFGAGFTHRDRAKGRGRPRTKGIQRQSPAL